MPDLKKGIKELATELKNGETTSLKLVQEALLAIAENDQDGKKLNTVSEISPYCLYEAELADREIRQGRIKGPLHGIPILVKDNIDVKGLHTTAGSYALRDNIADEDSPVVRELKAAGAIILGKSNMSEFAYWMSSQNMPSGYSSMSGQVVHADNPQFDPSGSSSGSAVAVAAGFVPGAIGTETCGSLMSPGIANAIVAIKPTVGFVSRRGIVPISHSQDTAGPMAGNVEDCACLLAAMEWKDEEDPASMLNPQAGRRNYDHYLNESLEGMRIGVYTDHAKPRTRKQETYQELLKKLITEAGGTVVELLYETTKIDCNDILNYEFQNGLERYLHSHKCRCRTLQDIIDFNEAHADRCLKHGQDLLIESNNVSGLLKENDYLKSRLTATQIGRELISDAMAEHELDCLVTACGSITSFAAVYGTCSMVVPAASFNKEVYEPVSYFLVGKPWGEGEMIHLGYALQEGLKKVTHSYNT